MYFVHLFGNNFEHEFLKNFEKHARFSWQNQRPELFSG